MSSASTLLKSVRLNAGMTQAELAARAGTQQATVARAERPGANPTVATLDHLVTAAGYKLELNVAPRSAAVDDAQIRERLRMTPAERVASFEAAYVRVQKAMSEIEVVESDEVA